MGGGGGGGDGEIERMKSKFSIRAGASTLFPYQEATS